MLEDLGSDLGIGIKEYSRYNVLSLSIEGMNHAFRRLSYTCTVQVEPNHSRPQKIADSIDKEVLFFSLLLSQLSREDERLSGWCEKKHTCLFPGG